MLLADVRNIVYEALNASKDSAYGTFDSQSPQWKTESIRDAIFDADYLVARTIAKTFGHPHRYAFVNSVTVSTPNAWTTLEDSDSKPEGVMIAWTGFNVPGETAPASKIQHWVANLATHGGVDVVNGYYDIVGNQIYFSGTTLVYKHYKVPALSSDSTSLNSPDVYRSAVVRLALSFLLSKDDVRLEAAQFYANTAKDDLIQIERGQITVPEFTAFQQVR